MNKKRFLRSGIVALVVFGVLTVFLLSKGTSYHCNFLIYICLFIIAAQGWNLLGGYIGEISFGHAVFWGIGAYAVALPMGYGLKIPLVVAVFAGALIAAVFALVISYPILRVQGFPFLIGTYGLGIVFKKVFIASPALFATKGVFLQVKIDYTLLYIVIAGLTVLTVLGVYYISKTSLGLQFQAVRDAQVAAQMVGMSIYRTKTIGFVMGAFLAGLAGALYFLYSGFINPTAGFGFDVSIAILLGPYIGGVGTVFGPVLGTIIVIFIQEWARGQVTITGGNHLILGVMLVLILLVSRKGIYPGISKLIVRLVNRFKGKRYELQG